MKTSSRLRIAIQKSGRLNNDSMDLLARCGLKIRIKQNALFCHGENLAIDILFVRDDDIAGLVKEDMCDLGIVGENVLYEKFPQNQAFCRDDVWGEVEHFEIIKKLPFGHCRLCIAVPEDKEFLGYASLQNIGIATSYPNLLQQYLSLHQVQAKIIDISGSVEIAPRLGMADAICDLVSTGGTLEENGLKEVLEVIKSQAVLIKGKLALSPEKIEIFELLLRRMEGVLKVQESKYIMFHAPIAALSTIRSILPCCETPTVMPLEGTSDKVAVHVVSSEGVFWSTLEKLKAAGANSILVLPIEKMLS